MIGLQSAKLSRRQALEVAMAAGAFSACASGARTPRAPSSWLQIERGRIVRNGEPCFFSGMNYWSAGALAADDGARGWEIVLRDLDALQGSGINLLRVMGASEGPDTEPWRMVPSLQPERGKYNDRMLAGMSRLVNELERRGVYAIVTLNNFWPWSGGMGQYLSWSGRGKIPYPPPQEGGNWGTYQSYAAEFFKIAPAQEAFREFLRFFVPRFASSPAVIWELANEPRGMGDASALTSWIHDTAGLIKSLAPRQLVTTGSEGETTDARRVGLDVRRNHESPHIDIVTCHIWAQNWGWVRPETLEQDFAQAVRAATAYLTHHADVARDLGKPLLLEEFGFPRDGASYDPAAPTTLRDRYFAALYELSTSMMSSTSMAGILPWAWSGATKPPKPGQMWKPGDPWTGDPPHESQGWYSIYETDASTMDLIRGWSSAVRSRGT
jgi:mannan endo-1,4-beta-mannosidase